MNNQSIVRDFGGPSPWPVAGGRWPYPVAARTITDERDLFCTLARVIWQAWTEREQAIGEAAPAELVDRIEWNLGDAIFQMHRAEQAIADPAAARQHAPDMEQAASQSEIGR